MESVHGEDVQFTPDAPPKPASVLPEGVSLNLPGQAPAPSTGPAEISLGDGRKKVVTIEDPRHPANQKPANMFPGGTSFSFQKDVHSALPSVTSDPGPAPANDTGPVVPMGPPPGSGGPAPAPRMGVGYGYRLPPIEVPYFSPDHAEKIHAGAMKALSSLDEQYRNGDLDEAAFEKGMDEIEAARAGELAKLDKFNQSLPGRMLGHARMQTDAQGRQLDIAKRGAEYDQWQSETQGQMLGKYQQDYEKLHQEHRARQDRIRSQVAAEVENYKTASKEISESKIDPDRFWHRKGTAGMIAAGLAMALGAVGGALTKTPNQAATFVANAIDRDIQAQMADIDNKKAGLAAQGNVVAMFREKLGDAERAEAAAKAHAYQGLEQQMSVLASTTKSKKVALRATAMQQEFADRRAILEDKYEIQAMQQAKMMELQRAQAAAWAAQAKQKAAQDSAMADQGIIAVWNPGQVPKEWKEVPGLGYATRGDLSADAIKKLRANKEVYELIQGALGGDDYNMNDRASRGQFMGRLRLVAKEAFQLGAISESDLTMVNDVTGDPNTWDPTAKPALKLKQLAQQTLADSDRTAGSIGLVKTQTVWGQDKKGQPRPRVIVYGQAGAPIHKPYSPNPVKATKK